MRWILTVALTVAVMVEGAIVVLDEVYFLSHIEIEGKVFLKASDLRTLGFRYVPAGTVGYLMYGKHTLKFKSDGTVVVDFIDETIEGGCVLRDDGFYVSSDLVGRFVELNWYRTPDGTPISTKPIEVNSIDYDGSKIVMTFSGTMVQDMIDVKKVGKSLKVIVSPVSTVSTSNVDFDLDSNVLRVDLNVESIFPPEVRFSSNTVSISVSNFNNFFGEVEIDKGLVWRRVREDRNGREYVVNYLDVDLDRFDVVPVIAKGGIGTLESVKSMVERTGAVAGVNASYFDPKTGTIIGLLVRNGKVLSGRFGSRPIFYITDAGATVRNDYLEVIANLGDVPLLVKGVNTLFKGEVLMYTSEFSKKIPLDPNKIYFVAKDGKVTSKGFKEKLDDGETLIGIDSKYSFAVSHVKVGDPFEVFINTDMKERIIQAVEAGPLIIKDGAPLERPSDEKNLYSPPIINSRRARTIVAVKSRRKISFIVVEDSGKGMNYNDMVDFLKDKGYEYAMCLDGGSSSSLVVKDRYVNLQPGEKEPLVAVGLLIFSK